MPWARQTARVARARRGARRGFLLSFIVAAVAGNCAHVAAVALGDRPHIAVYISGSSAQDQLLEGLMRLREGLTGAPNICQENSLDIFVATIAGTRHRLYFCLTGEGVPGVRRGRRLAVFKSSGGSGEGVEPLLNRRKMPFIAMDSLRSEGCEAQTRILPTGDLAAYTEHRGCTASVEMKFVDAGISDLEPALLGDVAGRLSTRSLSQLVWGLPVSRNFRNALQALQGLVPMDVAHDDPSRETLANMPTLTSTQISSIFAGAVSRWSDFYDSSGVPITRSALLAAVPAKNRELSGTRPGAYWPAALDGDAIYICRRIDSSGTQIAYATQYLRQRCTADAPAFIAPDDGSNPSTGGDASRLLDRPVPAGRVFAGIGTSDVKACLDLHDDHNRWAIGMFSTENVGNNASREYRHVRIDGVAPSLFNAHGGRWRHVSSASIQWPAASSDGGAQLTGRILAFIADHMGQPAVLRSLNRDFRHAWGQGGYLATVDVDGTEVTKATPETLAAHPVAGVSNARDGEPRNCQVPLLRGASAL